MRSVVLGQKLSGEEHALPLFVPENGKEEGGVGGGRGEKKGGGVEEEWSRSEMGWGHQC